MQEWDGPTSLVKAAHCSQQPFKWQSVSAFERLVGERLGQLANHLSRTRIRILILSLTFSWPSPPPPAANYPEHLGKSYLVNTPWIFHSMWYVIKAFLDEK